MYYFNYNIIIIYTSVNCCCIIIKKFVDIVKKLY